MILKLIENYFSNNLYQTKHIIMKFLPAILLLLGLSICGCKSSNKTVQTFKPSNPIEEFAVELLEVIKNKDFNTFENLIADEENIRKKTEVKGKNQSTGLSNSQRIFRSFYEKDIPWEKMKIIKVTSNKRGRGNLKFAEVMVKLTSKRKSCTINFPNWIKSKDKPWRLGSLPPEITYLSKM